MLFVSPIRLWLRPLLVPPEKPKTDLHSGRFHHWLPETLGDQFELPRILRQPLSLGSLPPENRPIVTNAGIKTMGRITYIRILVKRELHSLDRYGYLVISLGK